MKHFSLGIVGILIVAIMLSPFELTDYLHFIKNGFVVLVDEIAPK